MKLFTSLLVLFAITFVIVTATVNQQEFYHKWLNREFIEPQSTLLQEYKNEPLPADTKFTIENTFTVDNARIFSRLASAAYCAPPSFSSGKTKLASWTCQACKDSGLTMTNVTPFRIALADLHGYVGYNPTVNTVVLVFTGSTSIVNWLYNLDAAFIPFDGIPNAQIHKGFYNSWKYARPTVVAMLDSLFYSHPTASLTIAGHSLGGAVAHLATIDFGTATSMEVYDFHGVQYVKGNNLFDEKEMTSNLLQSSQLISKFNSKYKLNGATYTFGQPRIGNKDLSNFANAKLGNSYVFRTVNNQDLVPHVPPLLLWPTAQHAMTEVFYSKTYSNISDFKICPSAETPTCSNQFPLPTSFDDHLNYLGYHVGSHPDSYC